MSAYDYVSALLKFMDKSTLTYQQALVASAAVIKAKSELRQAYQISETTQKILTSLQNLGIFTVSALLPLNVAAKGHEAVFAWLIMLSNGDFTKFEDEFGEKITWAGKDGSHPTVSRTFYAAKRAVEAAMKKSIYDPSKTEIVLCE